MYDYIKEAGKGVPGLEKNFLQKDTRVEGMFMCDMYIPQARLVIELNGKGHFYPYTYKKDNMTNAKSKILREWGNNSEDERDYTVINLNV